MLNHVTEYCILYTMHNSVASVEKASLSHQIFIQVKRMILSGQLRGRERIPEEKIAADFGVSRTPIREALRRLEEYGLIRIQPRCFAEVLSMTPAEVAQLTLVRIALEKLSLELFLARAGEEDIAAIRQFADACRKFEGEGDFGGFYDNDSQFHLEIARRSGNPFLFEAMEKLDAKVQLSRLVKPMDLKDIRAANQEHEALLSVMADKNSINALHIMETHIRNNL